MDKKEVEDGLKFRKKTVRPYNHIYLFLITLDFIAIILKSFDILKINNLAII